MRQLLRRKENDAGEWSATDLVRNYRICRYNDRAHGGTHVHHPIESEAGQNLELASLAEAVEIIELFAAESDSFDLDLLREVVRRWKSGSRPS